MGRLGRPASFMSRAFSVLWFAFRFLVLFFGSGGAISVAAQETASTNRVVTYAAPSSEVPSVNYTVEVSGHPVFVYTTEVHNNPPVSFASFDFQGSAEVTVNSTRDVQSVAIRPASFGIKPVMNGRKIQFTLTQPRNVTIEINGSPATALHLFANPLEKDPPKAHDPHVVYFGPGVHEVSTLELHDGATLYLAGGAVLRGIIPPSEKPTVASDWAKQPNYKTFIQAIEAKNIRICGRGIIDASKLPWHARNVLVLGKVSDATIEGIIFIGSPCWTVSMFDSTNIHIRNIKEICALVNSDGIDICNSQDVTVEDCFLRNADDEICVKTPLPAPYPPAKNIVVRNCVIWNDKARGLGITNETRRDIDNVVFQNCDIIHDFSTAHDCAALAVIIDDSGTISHVRFEDIRLEDVKTKLLFCWIGKEMWGHDSERGHLKNVTFKNITVSGDSFPISEFAGYDETHLIENLTLDHLVIQGRTISDTQQGKMSLNPYVRDLHLSTGGASTP
jgi:hypothetical protein